VLRPDRPLPARRLQYSSRAPTSPLPGASTSPPPFRHEEITKENLPAKVEEIATAEGLKVPKLKDCMQGRKSLDAVKADQAEAAAVGVNGTPTFFVNGRRVQGANAFKQAIDQALGAKS